MLDAAKVLKERGLNIEWLILGRGYEYDSLLQKKERYGLDNVHFLGFRQNPYSYMKAADVTAILSEYEGLALTVAESLTAGTPVLSTRTGGVAELLPDEYGWIIENDLLSIIDGMTAIYDDRKLLEEKRTALRSYAYNNERIKESLDALFQTSEERGRAVMHTQTIYSSNKTPDISVIIPVYNTADYLNVDPLLGTNEEFEVLCREAAKYGIGIVLDGVFSHTGSDSRYFNREGRYGDGGAYRDPNSPYRSWYDFDPKYKGGYRSWWGFETLPEVNEETPSFVEFITGEGGVIDTWLRRGAAGFRLDVADELPDAFIEKIRTAVKRVSPEKFLLGEVWEDATTKYGFGQRRTYLLGKGLDSVMNYPFKNAVLDFVKGKPAEQAMGEILSICEHYPAPAMDTALNFLSTHDTERALTVIADEPANGRGREWQSGRCVTGEAYEEGMLRLRMAYAIIYTLPGVPCLYYGDEIGMQGYRDPFNRAFFCWDSHEERLRPVLAQLAQLRHSCEAFRTGELRVLRAEDGILHYQRIGKTETAEIIVNRSEHIIVEPLASGKHTEVNPMGFTIVVEENGHNPNHSYYDIQ